MTKINTRMIFNSKTSPSKFDYWNDCGFYLTQICELKDFCQ